MEDIERAKAARLIRECLNYLVTDCQDMGLERPAFYLRLAIEEIGVDGESETQIQQHRAS